MSFLHRTWAEIDLNALKNNIEVIKKNCSGELCAVVKADAYGHGVGIIVPELQKVGVKYFAVSNVIEALELRELGISGDIIILGYSPFDTVKTLAENNITQCVYSYEYAKLLSENAQKNDCVVKISLKFDTGMGRLGFDCRDDGLRGIKEAIKSAKLPKLSLKGAFTHFAVADRTQQTEDGFTKEQYDRFLKSLDLLKKAGIEPQFIHCANSAAILQDKDKHLNLCRAGIIMYGLMPDSAMPQNTALKPVMTFKSVVSFVKKINAGETVSYGRTFKAEKQMSVATVSVGYADGYPRALSNKGYVMINGSRANIIGRVCMDQMMVNVTGLDVKIGDEVVLFGKELSATTLANIAGTINYELICGVSKRVPRIVK